MSDPILFISDLHLEDGRPDILDSFFLFLDEQARQARALYVLGDFFNVWLGDDHVTGLNSKVADRLSRLQAAGTDVFLMHGNRDFLLGEDYAGKCGATLIDEPSRLESHGHSILLMHGDTLCTLDEDYQAFRAMVRAADWQKDFLAQPLDERIAFAAEARAKSQTMNSNKAEDIMDVTPEAVVSSMQEFGVHTLIHGHTHRPAVHEFRIDGAKAERYVLGDWDRQPWYIRLDDQGLELIGLQR